MKTAYSNFGEEIMAPGHVRDSKTIIPAKVGMYIRITFFSVLKPCFENETVNSKNLFTLPKNIFLFHFSESFQALSE